MKNTLLPYIRLRVKYQNTYIIKKTHIQYNYTSKTTYKILDT